MTTHIHHDFETYCDLDVRRVGAFKYAMHKSCEALILSWGTSVDDLRTWVVARDRRMPRDLLELLLDPEVELHAHNAQFEYCIWNYVVLPRYGLDRLPPERFRCTAAMAAAAGLPRSLDKVGEALAFKTKKDKEGQRLIKKFSAPRKPTKTNTATRIYAKDDTEDFDKYIEYNRTDVLAEIELAQCVPPLTRAEQRFYVLDLKMNERGLPLDMVAVNNAMPKLMHLEQKVVDKVTQLTGGIRPTQRDKMLKMFNGLGLEVENLQAKTVKDILAQRADELDEKVVQLLQLRIEGGKASTKKLKKMLELVCDDGRVRGGFMFYGAGTGRWAGRGIQPQNFTRGEYKPDQLERLFDLLKHGTVEDIELLYEWPIDAIAQGMRGFIAPPPGKKFVVSDFAAIEARKLAWLADEKPMLEVYRRNGDVYVRMASMLYNVPEEQLLAGHKAGDKDSSGKRKFGKDIVLGCFGKETKVLTKRGYVRIVDVLNTDEVWDGVEWVGTDGPAYMGRKEVVDLCGVKVTPDHRVLCGQKWYAAEEVARSTTLLKSAIQTGTLPWSGTSLPKEKAHLSRMTAGVRAATGLSQAGVTSTTESRNRARSVPGGSRPKQGLNTVPVCGTAGQWSENSTARTLSLARLWLGLRYRIAAVVSTAAAGIQTLAGTLTSYVEKVLRSARTASMSGVGCPALMPNTGTYMSGMPTCTSDATLTGTPARLGSRYASGGTALPTLPKTARSYAGTFLARITYSLIESTGSVITSRRTVDSSRSKKTSETDVYDLINCGPRNRFTILTQAGHMVVHNCGYQMGGPGFHRNCLMRGIIIDEDFAKRAVSVYREGHPAIVKYWADAERCAIAAVENQLTEREAINLRGTKFYTEEGPACTWLCIRLPSRYHVLRYVNPRVEMAERFGKRVKKLTYRSEFEGKWIRENTYGGKLVENITQASARDVMAEAMYRVEKIGYETIGTVHDELIEEVPVDFGSAHELETYMSVTPPWCPDSPISAEGWEGFRYRK